MPMYFPDLKSIKSCAESMARHTGDKKYKGIIPGNENQLCEARKQLADYFVKTWKDGIQAAEVFYGSTPENYDAIMGIHIANTMRGKKY